MSSSKQLSGASDGGERQGCREATRGRVQFIVKISGLGIAWQTFDILSWFGGPLDSQVDRSKPCQEEFEPTKGV
ncbi:unnamed protein product [Mesocestoides corti]|uniref:Uncharacterized protein n=1 Tax=Mesocestoides corti TaxID=53468 RepID=A0A0R3UM64_MESCO|nr:unnamed protein product [Mesocestoides corti]